MQEQQRNRQHLYLNGWSLFILFDEATKDNHVFAYSQFDSQDMVRKRAFMAFQAYLPVTVTHRPRSPAIQFSSVTVAARGGGRHSRSMTKNYVAKYCSATTRDPGDTTRARVRLCRKKEWILIEYID